MAVRNIIQKSLDVFRRLMIFLKFPHIWTCFIILIFAAVALLVSYQLNTLNESYWSSIFANLFAGLLTGFVICIIGSIKQISIFKMKEKRKWLSHLSEMILDYLSYHHKILSLRFDKFDGNEDVFELIYETGSRANWVNEEIIQSSFSKILSFNTIRYCKKNFDYDALALCNEYRELHEKLEMVDIDCPSSKAIIKYFESVNWLLWRLNSEVRKAIDDLDIRLSGIQKSII